MTIIIPSPDCLLALTWAGIGLAFARGFGKQLDHDIQKDPWFKTLSPMWQGTVKRLLDTLHHWWMGALLMVYCVNTPELYWLGWGVFVDDIPDIPPRLIKFLSNWQDYISDGRESNGTNP